MNPKDLYKSMIVDAVDGCDDAALLDLVCKMLRSDETSTPPSGPAPVILEVIQSGDHPRDQKQNGAVTVKIRRGSAHPGKDRTGVGNRRTELPDVCGGADSLPCAA